MKYDRQEKGKTYLTTVPSRLPLNLLSSDNHNKQPIFRQSGGKNCVVLILTDVSIFQAIRNPVHHKSHPVLPGILFGPAEASGLPWGIMQSPFDSGCESLYPFTELHHLSKILNLRHRHRGYRFQKPGIHKLFGLTTCQPVKPEGIEADIKAFKVLGQNLTIPVS